MKLPVRILLSVLCAALIICMPFVISSPSILPVQEETTLNDIEDDDEGEELDFGRIFISVSFADEAADEQVITEDIDLEELITPEKLSIPESWALPLDFSIPPEPDPEHFTENGYEDSSIRVRIETREIMDSTVHIAFVEIADASQFRTATAGGVNSVKTNVLQAIAGANHAVIAMNGDLFVENPEKKTFEVRMKQVVTYKQKRNRTNKLKDVLTVDENGDFHIFIKSAGLSEYISSHKNKTVNAFTFGPALVVDGEIPKLDTQYAYNPNGLDARSAIGQTGPLSYVMVIVEARGNNSKGVTHAQLAEIMKDLGCSQAYNLDGGNTAEILLTGPDSDSPLIHERGDRTAGKYRSHSDIIYFATAVPEEERD